MTSSKYFDSLRSSSAAKKTQAQAGPPCAWKGCDKSGEHKAPAGRGREGQYLLFCADHVREYNASYNYFLGMSDEQVAKFQQDAVTGHRPTWKTGMGEGSRGATKPTAADLKRGRVNDAHGFFAYRAKREAGTDSPRRYVKPLDRKALDKLHLPETATKDEIKARYKDLAKKFHPDLNQGDERSAESLREVIAAYNQLKASGLA
jgi:curved DNA-binding protein CbpA